MGIESRRTKRDGRLGLRHMAPLKLVALERGEHILGQLALGHTRAGKRILGRCLPSWRRRVAKRRGARRRRAWLCRLPKCRRGWLPKRRAAAWRRCRLPGRLPKRRASRSRLPERSRLSLSLIHI